jgi:hypothetical protein
MTRSVAIMLGLLVALTLSGFMVGQAFAQSPAVVQALTDHGVGSAQGNGIGGGANNGQNCVWQFSKPIATGDTVVGYVHTADQNDQTPMYPQAVTDNAGNTYNLSSPVQWLPWPEDIGIWYLTNIQGNPDTLTFNYEQYPDSGGTVLAFCDVGWVEYSGASSITVADPVLVYGTSPSVTISPPSPALIWAFASPYESTSDTYINNSGYSVLVNDISTDNMAVWGSNSTVPAGSLTLSWNAVEGSPGSCPYDSNGCPTVVAAVAVQGAPAAPPAPPAQNRHRRFP